MMVNPFKTKGRYVGSRSLIIKQIVHDGPGAYINIYVSEYTKLSLLRIDGFRVRLLQPPETLCIRGDRGMRAKSPSYRLPSIGCNFRTHNLP